MKRAHGRIGVLVGSVVAAAVAAAFAVEIAARADDAPAGAPPCPPAQKRLDHPFLNALVGEWSIEFTATDPTGKSHEGKGTSKVVLGVGGTALIEDYDAQMPEGPFAGHGITKLADDGKTVNSWWLDNMGPEPVKMTGAVTETTLELAGDIPGMGPMKVVSKKVEGGYDWDATLGGKPMMSQKYRKAK